MTPPLPHLIYPIPDKFYLEGWKSELADLDACKSARRLALTGLWGSIAAFVFAVGLAMYRFR